MRYKIYSTSEKAWKAMLAGIESAKTSVYLEMYILGDDSKGEDFFNALAKAAERGVRVVLLLDVLGSYSLFSSAVANLRDKGGEVIFCSFFWKRLHRKVLILDEKSAFIGGVNVSAKYAKWKDLQVEVRGSVVRAVTSSFARLYKKCGGAGDLQNGAKRRGSAIKKARLWFVDHGIGRRAELFREHYEERVTGAKKSIILITPYLLPPRWLIARLHQAMIRGVKVEILMPQASDHRLANSINRSYASFFTGLGAKCYFSPGMNHAKAMIIDGKEATVGSQNLDFLSMHLNIEAGVFFSEPGMVRDLIKVVETWKGQAEVFDDDSHGENKFHWYDIPIAFILRLFGFVPLE